MHHITQINNAQTKKNVERKRELNRFRIVSLPFHCFIHPIYVQYFACVTRLDIFFRDFMSIHVGRYLTITKTTFISVIHLSRSVYLFVAVVVVVTFLFLVHYFIFKFRFNFTLGLKQEF